MSTMEKTLPYKVGDRVKTTSNRTMGRVVSLPSDTSKSVTIRTTDGQERMFPPGMLLKCAHFFSTEMVILSALYMVCIVAPIGMGDLTSWLIYAASGAILFGGRAYKYHVQWV